MLFIIRKCGFELKGANNISISLHIKRNISKIKIQNIFTTGSLTNTSYRRKVQIYSRDFNIENQKILESSFCFFISILEVYFVIFNYF